MTTTSAPAISERRESWRRRLGLWRVLDGPVRAVRASVRSVARQRRRTVEEGDGTAPDRCDLRALRTPVEPSASGGRGEGLDEPDSRAWQHATCGHRDDPRSHAAHHHEVRAPDHYHVLEPPRRYRRAVRVAGRGRTAAPSPIYTAARPAPAVIWSNGASSPPSSAKWCRPAGERRRAARRYCAGIRSANTKPSRSTTSPGVIAMA